MSTFLNSAGLAERRMLHFDRARELYATAMDYAVNITTTDFARKMSIIDLIIHNIEVSVSGPV